MLSFSTRKQSDLFYFHCTEKLHRNSSLFHYLLSPSSASLLDTGNRKYSTFSHFVLPQPLWLLQPANMLSKMEGLSPLFRVSHFGMQSYTPLQSEGQAETDTVTSLHFTDCTTCIFSADTSLQRSLGGLWYERKQPRSLCLQSPNSRIETYAAYYSFFIFLTQKSVLKHIKSWHSLFTLSQTITLLSLCGSFNAK